MPMIGDFEPRRLLLEKAAKESTNAPGHEPGLTAPEGKVPGSGANVNAAIARIEQLPVNLGKVTRIRLEELAA